MDTIRRFLAWIKRWFWDVPITPPAKEPPLKIKAVELAHAYMVVTYHGQRVNMLKTEYPLWKAMNRKDKRAMAQRMEVAERKGQIRFEEVDGHLICIKNKNYEPKKEE